VAGQQLGEMPAQTTCRTGDERHFSRQIEFHACTCLTPILRLPYHNRALLL
jgi:hypothetical protein